MKRTFFQRFIAATVLIGAALGTASVAQARPDVHVSIGFVGLPGLPPLPVPIFRAEPVYVQPRPIYREPVTVYEQPWRPGYGYEVQRDRDGRHGEWQRREWERREWERRHHGWDRSRHGDRYGRD